MLTALFFLLLFVVFIRLIVLAVRAAWGIVKILSLIIFLPVVLIGLAAAGLMAVAFPALVVLGIAALAA